MSRLHYEHPSSRYIFVWLSSNELFSRNKKRQRYQQKNKQVNELQKGKNESTSEEYNERILCHCIAQDPHPQYGDWNWKKWSRWRFRPKFEVWNWKIGESEVCHKIYKGEESTFIWSRERNAYEILDRKEENMVAVWNVKRKAFLRDVCHIFRRQSPAYVPIQQATTKKWTTMLFRGSIQKTLIQNIATECHKHYLTISIIDAVIIS